jgi:UDP-glucose 4-epimerase
VFTIFGDDYPTPDGTCIRDYIHVSDLADAHVRAVRDLLQGGRSAAINIGTGRGWSVRELVDIAQRVTGRDVPLKIGPRRAGDPPELVSDPALARIRLGWTPRYTDAAEQIAHAWAWRQNGCQTYERARRAE